MLLDWDTAKLLAEHGTSWVPTRITSPAIPTSSDDLDVPRVIVETAQEIEQHFESTFDAALSADITIAMGSNAGTTRNNFDTVLRDLEPLVDSSLLSEEALQAGIINAAVLMCLDK
jgi:imidazolonepropionase-like amidohydrolase